MTKTLKEIMQNFTSEEQAEIQAEREALRQDLKKHPYPYFVRDWKTIIDTPISQETYNELKKVHEKLIEVLFIEEKLDILLSNYFELEQTLLDLSLKSSIFNYEKNQDNSFDELNLVDRRIVNLLASCRIYIDQTANSFSTIYGQESEEYIKNKETKSIIYDSSFSYRLMEKLCNHNKHFGLLISKISKKALPISENESCYLEHRIDILSRISYLEQNSGFNKSVLKELKDLESEEYSLIKHIREYIRLIGKIHLEIREILKKDTEEWSKFYIDLIQKYKSHKKETGKTLVSFFRRDANSSEIIERFDLIQDIIISRCQKLQQKNSKLNLQFTLKNYVSSKID